MPGKRSRLWLGLAVVIFGGALGVGAWLIHKELTSGEQGEPIVKAGLKTEPVAPKEEPKKPVTEPIAVPGAELAVTPLVPGEKERPKTVAKALPKKPVEKKPVEKKPVEKKPIEKKPIEKKPVEKKPPPAKVASAGYMASLRRGQKLYRAGKLKAAAQSLEKAVEANPRGVAALVALANAYFEMDRNKNAVVMAKRALAVNPKSARAHLTLGTIYQTMGNNGMAKKAYRQYLKLEPKGRFAQDVRSILKSLD